MKTTRTIKIARPRRFGVSFFLLVALLGVSLFAGACGDKHKKMADRHDEILRQEGD